VIFRFIKVTFFVRKALKISDPHTNKNGSTLTSLTCPLLGPGSRSSSTSSLSSIASGAPPTPTSPRRRLASEPLDSTTKTPLRDQQQANNQVNCSGTNSSSNVANKLQPLRKNTLPGEFQAAFVPHCAQLSSKAGQF